MLFSAECLIGKGLRSQQNRCGAGWTLDAGMGRVGRRVEEVAVEAC